MTELVLLNKIKLLTGSAIHHKDKNITILIQAQALTMLIQTTKDKKVASLSVEDHKLQRCNPNQAQESMIKAKILLHHLIMANLMLT